MNEHEEWDESDECDDWDPEPAWEPSRRQRIAALGRRHYWKVVWLRATNRIPGVRTYRYAVDPRDRSRTSRLWHALFELVSERLDEDKTRGWYTKQGWCRPRAYRCRVWHRLHDQLFILSMHDRPIWGCWRKDR